MTANLNTPQLDNSDRLINLLNDTMTALVASEDTDLTSRQSAVLLTCYLRDELQTVRGLSKTLNISKPAITRAIDKLENLKLVERVEDAKDRRSVLLRRTTAGKAYVSRLRNLMARAEIEPSSDSVAGVEMNRRSIRSPRKVA
jgi:DNA-binding MarR family transcriptional regulator